ncbi:hypothetical protein E1B28_005595 [Marasmius oreades]|nr:uncharacterized protein E1B28_005595 [Marasmius oreades]KAG7094779.1 hypothetical protein E1B28_005595 [Marasmius oreades]
MMMAMLQDQRFNLPLVFERLRAHPADGVLSVLIGVRPTAPPHSIADITFYHLMSYTGATTKDVWSPLCIWRALGNFNHTFTVKPGMIHLYSSIIFPCDARQDLRGT